MKLPTIFPVTCHTNFVDSGSTFVVIKGFNADGVCYIPQAIQKGASKIVLQKDVVLPPSIESIIKKNTVDIERVVDTRLALAQLSAQAAGYPAKQLKIIGVTGTKGKTTTVFLLEHILSHVGYKTALISTVHNKINGHHLPSSLTTPQPDYLHQFLKMCVNEKVEYVVMEVAAQALTLHRVAGIYFDGIIFANLALEHLEFYASMEDYFAAKCSIFNQRKKDAPCLINADNEWGIRIVKNHHDFFSFGMQVGLDFCAKQLEGSIDKLAFNFAWQNKTYNFVVSSLLGAFNIYNALAAIGMACTLGIDYKVIALALQLFPGIRGRFERHQLLNGATCIIDYAHNPLSYQAVLSVLRQLTDHLIVVFGAGGQRDTSKRPLMGGIAAQLTDYIILTSDNPRTEDPHKIIQDIMNGVSVQYQYKVVQEVDRKKAIEKAYTLSRPTSIIAILGKGSDEYQIIGNTKIYFSEVEIIKELK